MFSKLRSRIIITTMAITTAVLILAGGIIMFFSSTVRPEPAPRLEQITITMSTPDFNDQTIREFINTDRQEGNTRLLITLLYVGLIIEVAVFLISYYLSKKIVEPVKDSYDKQKIFIANASHELKTPLAVIQANIEALDVDSNNAKWKTNIENEITHANKLVLDLLQLAKMDADSTNKTPAEQVDLATELQNHIDIFKPKSSGNITFKTSTKSTIHSLPKQDILQIIDILLDNATKYGDKKIAVTLKQDSLTISNDGATISKDDCEKVFDRFYQTDKTSSGSGLGLAIAKALCDQNGWTIRCESTPHQTKFTLTFQRGL